MQTNLSTRWRIAFLCVALTVASVLTHFNAPASADPLAHARGADEVASVLTQINAAASAGPLAHARGADDAASVVTQFDAAVSAQSAVHLPAVSADTERPQFSGYGARRHVDSLANGIGSRPAGSENQERATQYIYDQLSALGYQTELQSFPITFYEDRGSSLTLAGPLGRAVQVNTIQYSQANDVEGELVDAGLGRAGDFNPESIAGRIALIKRGEIKFSEKVENVAAAGAIGAIIYNNLPGNFAGSLVGTSQIPAISISDADGEQLAEQVGRGAVLARVSVSAGVETRTATNVIATMAGGPQTVVIGGHYDSVASSPGGNDNASGTAVMIELARVLAASPSPFTMKLVAFDAEEIGLRGSAHMVAQLTDEERQSTRAMINLDMVGVGDQSRLGGSAELTRLAHPIAARLGERAQPIGEGIAGGSDHASFMRADIPSLFVYRSNDVNYHSPNDRAEYVEPANLEFAGQLVLNLLDVLATGA